MKNNLTVSQLEAKIRPHPEAWSAYREIRQLIDPDLRLAWELKALLGTLHQLFHRDLAE